MSASGIAIVAVLRPVPTQSVHQATIQFELPIHTVTYHAGAEQFCGLLYVDGIFTNRTVLQSAEEVLTDAIGSATQS